MEQEIRWFAIAADNSYTEYIDHNNQIQCSYWIRRTDTGKRHTTMYGNTFEIFNYDLFNTELKPFKYTKSGWKLHSCNNYEYKNTSENLTIEIVDPNGQLKEFRETEREIDGILKSIEKVNMLSKFKDWRDFENFDQIRILEEKNAKLESEIQSLKYVITDFKKSDFFKQLLLEIKGVKESQEINEILRSKGLPKTFHHNWISSYKVF